MKLGQNVVKQTVQYNSMAGNISQNSNLFEPYPRQELTCNTENIAMLYQFFQTADFFFFVN
jgi:hypothetical protein